MACAGGSCSGSRSNRLLAAGATDYLSKPLDIPQFLRVLHELLAPPTTRQRRSRGAVPQLTAFLTSAPILASSSAVSSVSAKAVGHMLPSSRFAVALNPNVAYRSLNFEAGVK
jgi:DNA-binding NtrC family response regulator